MDRVSGGFWVALVGRNREKKRGGLPMKCALRMVHERSQAGADIGRDRHTHSFIHFWHRRA